MVGKYVAPYTAITSFAYPKTFKQVQSFIRWIHGFYNASLEDMEKQRLFLKSIDIFK